MTGLRVGEVARRAGVNLQTVHYYERRGLLPKPPRSESNYRVYPEDAVLRVRFIKRAQELGFSLKEIKELLALRIAPRTTCADIRVRAKAKIDDIEDRIRTLHRMKQALTKLASACSGKGAISACPILEALEDGMKRKAFIAT